MRRPHGTITRGGCVGIKLVVETMKHAPAEISSAERLLLIVLAEQASDTTRECWPGMDLIQQHAGLTHEAVRKALQRLAARGLEVRVPLGNDRKGRNVYAFQGQRTRYRIPHFAPSGGTEFPSLDDESRDEIPTIVAGQDSHHSEREVGTSSLSGGNLVPERWEEIPTLSLKNPQDPSSSSRPIDLIRASGVVKEEEEDEFHQWIIKDRDPRSPLWWKAVVANDNFQGLAERWRAQRPRPPRSTALAECTDCQTPTKHLGANGLCTACQAYQVAEEFLRTVPNENRTKAESQARAEGFTSVRAVKIRAVELLYASYPDVVDPDWPPPEVSP